MTELEYAKRCGCGRCKAYIKRETNQQFKAIIKAYAQSEWVPLHERVTK